MKKMSNNIYDVAVIGAGIVGLATALKLSQSGRLKIAVIEAEEDVARHQTGNNSGVIHSGLYYKPGSSKAQNCVKGREQLYRFCQEYDIRYERCGKIVVATTEKEKSALENLFKRGVANGLTGIKKLSAEQINEYEPHIKGVAALRISETGIVDYSDVAKVYQKNIINSGADVFLNHTFIDVNKDGPELILATSKAELRARYLINCGGLFSDRIAKKCGVNISVKIVPFRGEYYKLVPEKEYLVNNLVYPVPDPSFPFLGVHFTRMVKGGVEAGPNAVLAFKRTGYLKNDFSLKDFSETITFPGFLKLAGKYWYTGFGEFYRSFSKKAFVKALQKLLPELQEDDISEGSAGVRAQALSKNGQLIDDFKIEQTERMIHVLNAPSPAATASLSIGETIAQMAYKHFNLM